MAQKYYEYAHYKQQEERRPPRGSHVPYLVVFQAIFYCLYHVSARLGSRGSHMQAPGPSACWLLLILS